jgi:nucleotide-binding universal stress UspA family protein
MSLAGGIEKIHHHYHAYWVVMGTHGATRLKKFFLGSNAVYVLQNADIPVLTVPGQFSFKQMNHIAYASDFDNMDEEIVQVVEFAKMFEAYVHVMHVAEDTYEQTVAEAGNMLKK